MMKRFTQLILTAIILPVLAASCGKEENEPPQNIDYRQEMRSFVKDISSQAKNLKPRFLIIPQNGQALFTDNGEPDGTPQTDYLDAVDATGREDLFYGYDNDDEATPADENQYMRDLCLLAEQYGIEVLTTDYCSTHSKMDNSYLQNNLLGFISFAADNRQLNNIPAYPEQPYNVNPDDITEIAQAKNFLYLINGENFAEKQDLINAVSATDYDLVILDLFQNDESWTPQEIEMMKTKQNGGRRLVVCYVSIGEAEDYRYYWQQDWYDDKPAWLETENPDWEGNFKVRYWNPDWQSLICGNDDSYIKKIVDAGFDGAYLDIIDAYEYFEEKY